MAKPAGQRNAMLMRREDAEAKCGGDHLTRGMRHACKLVFEPAVGLPCLSLHDFTGTIF